MEEEKKEEEVCYTDKIKTMVVKELKQFSDTTELTGDELDVLYKLVDIDKFRPEIATIINLSPDHLETMGSLDAYYKSKTEVYYQILKVELYIIFLCFIFNFHYIHNH